MRLIPGIVLFSMLLGCSACKNDEVKPADTPAKLNISINAKWEAEDFVMQEVYYDNYGNRLRVDNFMTYISMLSLIRNDGTEVLLKDFILHDFSSDGTFTFDVNPGEYTGVKFGLGIPEAYNKHEDPAQYANSHPLSVAGSQGMFWHWNTGYIFTKFEGKADTTGTEGAELLHSFSFHIGDDPFYAEFTSGNETLSLQPAGTAAFTLNVHIDELLGVPDQEGSIDLATDAITHTSGNTELAEKFVSNFVSSITID